MADTPYSFDSFIKYVNQNFVVILLVVIGLGVGFFVGSIWTENQIMKKGGLAGIGAAPTAAAPTGPEGPTPDQLAQLPEVTDKDHIRGNKDAKVMLVEYSDYECPFCASFHPTLEAMMEQYGDDVAWVYRHYPLPFHPLAQPSAEAAECVAKFHGNDGFWAYSDKLFEMNAAGTLTEDSMMAAISELGYDQSRVESCVDSGEMKSVVDDHYNSGTTAGVSGTPGTFIVTKDGAQELIPGALPEASVSSLIEKYL